MKRKKRFEELKKYERKLHKLTSIVGKYSSMNTISQKRKSSQMIEKKNWENKNNSDINMLNKMSQATNAIVSNALGLKDNNGDNGNENENNNMAGGNGGLQDILRQEIENENEETVRLDKFLQNRMGNTNGNNNNNNNNNNNRMSITSIASSTFDITESFVGNSKVLNTLDTPTRSMLFVRNFIHATQLENELKHENNENIFHGFDDVNSKNDNDKDNNNGNENNMEDVDVDMK